MQLLRGPVLCLGICLFVSTAVYGAKNKIPSYIKICKRNDPHLEDCILDSIEKLRPKLKTGIPELEVPPLEPLVLPVVDVSRGQNYKAFGRNLTVHGASEFKITNLRVDLKNTNFYVGIKIPVMEFYSLYEIDARVLVLPLKGKGTVQANATDVTGDATLKARKVKKNGDIYLDFYDLKMKLNISNYNVHLDNLFNGNKELGKAVNRALNDNKREFMDALRPVVERVVSNVLLDIAKKITRNFTYDELFPVK